MDYLPNRIECSEGSKSSALLEPVAHDLTFLMLYFLAEVQQGASLSFDTFKTIWRKLRFSLLLTICPRRQSQHSYMQALYAVPLIAVRSGISAETLSHIATEDTSQAIKKDHGLDLTSLLQVNDFVDICKHGSIQLTFAAICTLYCLYFAQQIALKVRIHVSLDHQDALKDATVLMHQAKIGEALYLLYYLYDARALVPGTMTYELRVDYNQYPSNSNWLTGSKTTQASSKEEANAAREVRYHVNSTLSGLGSGHLDTICSRYKNHLQNLWSAFNPDGGPAPEGVAELTLGLWVHKYVDEKSKEVDRILNHGKRRRKAVLQPDGKKFPTEIEIEDVSRAKIPSGKSLGATSQKKEEMSRHRGKISCALGGMAAISDKVTAREKARKKDMLRRAKPWTDQLGISDLLIFSNSNNILEQEDMPVIPNLT